MDTVELRKTKLPELWKHATWHPETGLVVSPLTPALPDPICTFAWDDARADYLLPRLLTDDRIYLAFFPRRSIAYGALFSVLRVPHLRLSASIMPVRVEGHGTLYELDRAIAQEWDTLEHQLNSVAHACLTQHPKSSLFPPINPPVMPSDHDYLGRRRTHGAVLRAAKEAQETFRVLVALTSFSISLWLTTYEDDCLDAVFTMLASHSRDPVPRVWLGLLQDSIVCDWTVGIRPGAYLDPFDTRWGQWIYRFARAGVPIWLAWGLYDDRFPRDLGMSYYYPPQNVLNAAKKRPVVYSSFIVPHVVLPQHVTKVYNPDPENPIPAEVHHPNVSTPAAGAATQPAPSGYEETAQSMSTADLAAKPPPPPADPTTVVEAHSRQLPRESWPEFFERMSKFEERRKETEKPADKQRREALATYAAKSGWSKKSKVFEWIQDHNDPTFYRRSRIVNSYAEDIWRDYPRAQRFYWSTVNEWDLCPQVPNPDAGAPACCDFDDDHDEPHHEPHDEPHNEPQPLPEPSTTKPTVTQAVGSKMLETARAIVASDIHPVEEDYKPHLLSLEDYLCLRHGYYAYRGVSWNPTLHAESSSLPVESWDLVVRRLLYTPENMPEAARQSLVEFHNVVANEVLGYKQLPRLWDISWHGDPGLACYQHLVRLQRVECVLGEHKELYILRPPRGSKDTSRWFIATTSPTAVLLVYRSQWFTMQQIGRGFLKLGIPFRTVLEVDAAAVSARAFQPTRVLSEGLGLRSIDFKPTHDEFMAYEAARDHVLHSPAGRAIRLRGGITGRLAAEVVPDVEVLDGPTGGDEVVGRHGNALFVDDKVDDRTLDVVSGVYYVKVSGDNPRIRQDSYWPKHSTWMGSGLSGDQWSPAAEHFYQKRLATLRARSFDLKKPMEWKKQMKFNRPHTIRTLAGSERLAADFLKNSSRVL